MEPRTRRFFSQYLFSFKLNPQTVIFAGYSDMTHSALLRVFLLAVTLSPTLAADAQSKSAAPLAVGDLFPRLEAEFLTGRKAVLPDAAAGKSRS